MRGGKILGGRNLKIKLSNKNIEGGFHSIVTKRAETKKNNSFQNTLISIPLITRPRVNNSILTSKKKDFPFERKMFIPKSLPKINSFSMNTTRNDVQFQNAFIKNAFNKEKDKPFLFFEKSIPKVLIRNPSFVYRVRKLRCQFLL